MTLRYTSVATVAGLYPMVGSVTTLTSADLYKFAYDAEAMVDGYVARLYDTTSTAGIPLLEALATDITMYNVLAKRIFTQERLKDSGWPDRFKEAKDTLKEIAEGTISLVVSGGTLNSVRTDRAQIWSTTKGYVPTIAELDERLHRVDPDKIDDLESERDVP